MPYDFPSGAVNGQQVTGSGGQVYTFDGTKWVATATTAGVSSWNTRTGAVTMSSGDVTTALTYTPYNATNPSGYQTAAQVTTALAPYAPLAAPVFTGDARAVTPAYGDNDTSVATSAFVQSAVAPAFNGVGRNLLHNGTFVVQQRGAGPWTTTNSYTVDRWQLQLSNDTASVSPAGLPVGGVTGIGDESAKWVLNNTFTGNAVAGAFNAIAQKIEGVTRLSGKTVTISFYASSSAAGLKLGLNFTLFYGSGGSPSTAAWAFATGTPVTLATGWARYSATFTMPTAVGKTLGTSNDDATWLYLFYSSGANTNATAGNIGVQSGTIQLWGVQLEIGTQATPLDAGGTPQQILAECQRFYQTGSIVLGVSNQTNGGGVQAGGLFPVLMRASPTMTTSNNASSNIAGFSFGALSASAFYTNGTSTVAGSVTINASFTASADL